MRQGLNRFFPWLVYAALFLLPWQTRYIFDRVLINGEPFEYGVLSVYAVELIVLTAFFVGQRLNIRREHALPVRAMGIVLLAALISIPFAVNGDIAMNAWMHLLFAGALFVVLLDQRVDKWQALLAFTLGLVAPSILGLVQVVIGSSPASTLLGLAAHHASDLGTAVIEQGGGRLLRAYGSLNHPNVFGGYLAIGVISALLLLFRGKKIAYPLLPLFSFALIATFSRSAWLALAAALCVGAGLLVVKHRAKICPRLLPIGLLVISLAAAVAVFSKPLFSRFDANKRLEQISVTDRVEQYQAFPKVVKGHLATGVGIGDYPFALSEVRPGESVWAYQPIHNVPLLVLGEVGILGVLAMLFWAGSVDRLNYAAIRRGNIAAIGGIVLGTVPLVIIFFDHYLWSSWSGLALLAFLMAMTLRLSE